MNRPLSNTAFASLLSAIAVLLCSCKPSQTTALLQPNQALGVVLAEEAARLGGPGKPIAIIEPDSHWGPVSLTEEVFKNTLAKQGVSIVFAKSANLGDPMRSGAVGLKASDFFEALEKAKDAGAIVSFAGAPLLKPEEIGQVDPHHPPLLVVATASLGEVPGVPGTRGDLAALLDAKILQLVIVDGAADSPHKTDATHELFSQHYLILSHP